jgi:hypothetical protein
VVCLSIRLRGLRQKAEKYYIFQAAADPSANQIAVTQIHSWIHFAITSRKKQEKSGRYIFLKKGGMIGLFFSHLFVSSFVFISTSAL